MGVPSYFTRELDNVVAHVQEHASFVLPEEAKKLYFGPDGGTIENNPDRKNRARQNGSRAGQRSGTKGQHRRGSRDRQRI